MKKLSVILRRLEDFFYNFRQGYWVAGAAILAGATLSEVLQLPEGIMEWDSLLKICFGLMLVAACFVALWKLFHLQRSVYDKRIDQGKAAVASVGLFSLAIWCAGEAPKFFVSSVTETDAGTAFCVLLLLFIVIWLGMAGFTRKMGGLSERTVARDENGSPTQTITKELQPNDRPGVLILAMSRPSRSENDKRSETQFRQGKAALRDALEHLEAQESVSDDPLGAYLDYLENQKATNHSWVQTARSLKRHFGSKLKGDALPEVYVVVSAPGVLDMLSGKKIDNEYALDDDRDWLSSEEESIGFKEFLTRLLKLRFGPEAETIVKVLGHRPTSIYAYAELENKIRNVVRHHRHQKSVSVDVTSGTKVFSVAAGAATLDEECNISYVDTKEGAALLFLSLTPVQRSP